MTPPSPASASRPHNALRRWLRYSWLSRLPLVGRFLRPRKPQPAPKTTRKSTPLETLQLEVRSVPNDPFGMAQAALGATAVAELAGTFQTPAQVLLRGWGGGAAASWQDERAPQGGRERDEAGLLRPTLSDAYFAPLSVAPRREDDNEARTQEAENQRHPAQTEPDKPAQPQEPERLVLATELMRDPVDDDFLDRVGQALQDPLASATGGGSGGGGGGGTAGSAGEHGGAGTQGDAGTAGPSLAASDSGTTPGGAGGGGSVHGGQDTGFDPFLSQGFGQGGPPATAAHRGGAGGGAAGGGAAGGAGTATGGGAAAGTGGGAGTGGSTGGSSGFTTLALASTSGGGTAAAAQQVVVTPPSVNADFGRLPLAFEANEGQTDPQVRFLARARGYQAFVTPTEVVAVLNKLRPESPQTPDQLVRDVLRIQFVGAGADAPVVGAQELQGRSNYFGGGQAPVTDIAQFGEVVARDVWQGIDIHYLGDQGSLRFDVHLRPGSDISQVALNYVGTDSVSVDGQGELVLHTASGDVVQQAPTFYSQDTGGTRRAVAGSYQLRQDGTVGFAVGDYDRSAELVIDPSVTFATYLGGSGNDYGNAVAVDAQGNIYVVGQTASTNFPTQNPYQSTLQGNTDVFVTKMRADGSALVYSTYLGGASANSTDNGTGIAVDAGGYAYVTGSTDASDFPTTSGAYQTSRSGTVTDGFVTRLSPAGNALVYSTYLGGSSADTAYGIAVDGSDAAYVTGTTQSTNFPTTTGAYQTSLNMPGTSAAFVTKLKPDGSGLVYSSYLGSASAGTTQGNAIAVDAAGHAYVAGYTQQFLFPTVSAYDSSLGGTQDGFLTQFNAAGSGLVYSTFLGGGSPDEARGVAVDHNGQAYVAGLTTSSDYPTTTGAYDTTLGTAMFPGGQDAFVTRVGASGSTLGYSTFLGGSGTEAANAVAIDGDGNAFLTGWTLSSDFPTTSGAYQSSHGGGTYDAFVTRLESGGASLGWSTYLGGSGDDRGNGIAVDLDGNAVVTGQTASTNFPLAAPYQGNNAGNTDAFLAKFNGLPPPVFTSISFDSGSDGSDQITNDPTLTISGTSVSGATVKIYRAGVGLVGTVTASGTSWTLDYTGTTLAEGTYAFTATATSGGKTSLESAPFLVTVDLTLPSVTLTADATTYDKTPTVRVTATDLNLAASTTATVDVDLNNNGIFETGTSEMNYASGTLSNGVAVITLPTALSIATVGIRARVTDKAGNEGTSATKSVQVQSSGSGYTTTDLTPQVDPFTGDALFQRGNLTLVHQLDLDLSPGTDVGGSPALVYNSDRVSVQPIIVAAVQSDNSVAPPSTITATLTWNGTAQTAHVFSTSGVSSGDLVVAAQQVSSAVTTTGRYTYSLQVSFDYTPTPVTRTINGAAFVVAEDASAYGAGWTLGSVDKLISISQQTQGTFTYSAGMLREYGYGGYGFYTDTGGNTYTSPAGDNGTLTKASGGGLTTYTYTRTDGSKQTFDNSGTLVKATSADGFAALTYTYSSGNLTGIATPDGALTTLTLVSGKVSTIKTSARTVTLTVASNDLTGITNPDGGLRTLAYDGSSHRLTDDRFSVLRGTYAYSNGALTGFTSGDSSIVTDTSVGRSTVSPASLFGLSSLAAGPVLPSVIDPLGQVTRKQLDTSGRPTLAVAPDGGATQFTRDNNGWVTKVTDPLNRVTTIVLDSAGYPTSVTMPDGNSRAYTYQAAFHALTQYTDERGNLYTYTYDANNGHRLTAKDPLNQVTSYTYNTTSGLPETVKDALGRVSTALYDSARRLQTTINALGDRATVTYDGNGNMATQVDELGRTTTFVNDALGRVTQRTDAAGGLWTTTYNGAGMVSSAKDALARLTNYTYNSRGEQTRVVEASGTAQERSQLGSFDTAGQQTSSRDADGVWSSQAFDAAGRPKTSTDALGGQALSVYDLASQQTRARDQLGRPTDSVFDGLGRVTKSTDALGNVTSTVYDPAGNVTEVDDARGFKVTYAYDKLNRQTAVTEAAGTTDARTMTTVYDAVGNVYQTIDALGRTTENTYDALNRLTQVTEAKTTSDARSMTYAYDKVGNQTSTTDWRGYRTDATFDKLNRITVVKEAAGTALERVGTTVYDAVGNVTSSVDALGRTASMVFDALNRAISSTEAVGTAVARTMTTLYDAADNQTSAVDALGHASQSVLDVLGRLSVSIDPLGNLTRSFYDAASGLRAGLDANGNRTDYFTDGLGRTERVVDALGNTVTSVYDAIGNTTGTIDARGNRGTLVYDGLNRVIARTDALNHTVTSVYNKAGNVVQTIDAQGKTLTYTYDNLNRRITVQDPGTGVSTTVYDAAGNVVNTIDPLGHKATMVYDELGRKTKDIDALAGTTTYLYDALDNRTGLIDPVGNRTTFVLDALNRVTQETDPLNKSLTMAYDAADRVTSKTDRLGRRIDYVYDDADRLLTETWRNSGGSVVNTLTHVYDANSNETVAQDSHGAYTFTYDSLNRASMVKGLFGVTLTFSYDGASNRTKVEDSFGGVLTSVYDAANRLTSRQFGGSGQTPLRFDLAYTERNQVGTLTRYSDLAGSTKVGESDYTYDSVGRLQNLQHKNGSNTVLSNYTYTYDLASRVTSEKLNGGSPTSYSYDNTDQLTNDGTKTYTYDGNGNRTMAGYTTGPGNRVSNDGVYTYTYDDEGNNTKKSKGTSAETWNYTYDNRNQLTGVEERATDGGTLLLKATYTYDVFNRRVQEDKWVSGSGSTTVRLANDSDGTTWADLDGSNNLVTRYLRRDGAVQPVARIASGAATWMLEDHLGSVRNTTNGTGVVNGTVVFDGYGNITSETSPTATGRYAYTGLVQDREVVTVFADNRVYDPPTGTWRQQDPDRFGAGDTKLDRYVGNNPINATDPSGLAPPLVGPPAPLPPLVGPPAPQKPSVAQPQIERMKLPEAWKLAVSALGEAPMKKYIKDKTTFKIGEKGEKEVSMPTTIFDNATLEKTKDGGPEGGYEWFWSASAIRFKVKDYTGPVVQKVHLTVTQNYKPGKGDAKTISDSYLAEAFYINKGLATAPDLHLSGYAYGAGEERQKTKSFVFVTEFQIGAASAFKKMPIPVDEKKPYKLLASDLPAPGDITWIEAEKVLRYKEIYTFDVETSKGKLEVKIEK